MTTVDLGGVLVGDGARCFVIAELGINHSGSVLTAEKLIDVAAFAGAQAVKLQKRTIEAVFTPEELARPRGSPFGKTNGDLKRALELDRQAYVDLARYAKAKGLQFTASCWDVQALDDVMAWTDPPWLKIASAVLTWPSAVRDPLLRAHALTGKAIVMSTGMSDFEQIDEAIAVLRQAWSTEPRTCFAPPGLALLACTSTYPCEDEETHLRTIDTLRERFGVPVGWSGHERGLAPSLWAVARHHACILERHITLDRASFGSDQAASLEPPGFARLVRDIRIGEKADGDGAKRCLKSEEPVRAKLMRR